MTERGATGAGSRAVAAAAIWVVAAGMAAAQDAGGDPEAGEAVFDDCTACHVVTDEDGTTLAGRAGRVGPNLYGLSGRTAGAVEDYRYSSAMEQAGEAGLVWTVETVVPYLLDPTSYLRQYLDDPGARGKMSYRLRDEQDALDVFAYIDSLGAADGG